MTTQALSGRVAALFRYPISSLLGERLAEARIGPDGIEGDRSYGLFDRESGIHIYPARDARWNDAPLLHSRLKADRLEISLDGGDWLGAVDGDADAVLARLFGRPVDLRAYDDAVRPRYKVAPLHVLSVQAMAALRTRLPASLIDERRFRPNILIDLPEAAGEIPEYALLGHEFTLGDLRLRGTVPCGRCGFTSLPVGDLPSDPEVLKILLRHHERNFGIYCEVLTPGSLSQDARLSAEVEPPSIDPVVIVGAGQAGAMTALALRRLGYAGKIRIYGAERHPPYERPPLSKRLAGGDASQPSALLSPVEAEDADISLHLDTPVVAVDPDRRVIETLDGTEANFGTLVLSTGGVARRLPELDRGYGRVHVLRTIEDAGRMALFLKPGSRVAVYGGGWIGMEIASVARQNGAEVTLFARSQTLAPRILPPAVAQVIEALHRDAGVILHLGIEPRFRETAHGVSCAFGAEALTVDHLIVAIGMVANDGLARRAGLACDGGICVDDNGATDRAGIYAVGDVAQPKTGRIESWHNTNLQAERVARRILQRPEPPAEPPRFWSDQFGKRIQIIGRPDPKAVLMAQEPGRFWNFGGFAIGIDAPEPIHRFARDLAVMPPVSGAQRSAAPAQESPGIEQRLCGSSDIAEGELKRMVDLKGRALAVTRQEGRVYVTSDDCPHAEASLTAGFVSEGRIVCPLHFAEFRLDDGEPHQAPAGCGRLKVYPAREREGDIFIILSDD